MGGIPALRAAPRASGRIVALAAAGLCMVAGAGLALDEEGRGFGPEWRVNASPGGNQGQPRVASDPAGGFVVVWQDDLGDPENLFALGLQAQRYGADGNALGGEFRLDGGGGSSGSYAVAMDAAGRFVVVHHNWTDNLAVFRLFGHDGAALGGERPLGLLPDERLGFGRPTGMDAYGNFAVVSDGATELGTVDIRVRLFAAGGAPRGSGPFVPVATGLNGGWQHNTTIGVGPAGHFVVAWNDVSTAATSGQQTQIHARLFEPDGASLTPPFQVSTTADENVDPQVAVDAAGNFIVAWTHGQDHVRARAYDRAGAPRGPDFQVSQGGQAGVPDVAIDGAGNSVVAWYNVVDGWREDIFVRRYDAAAQPRDAAPVQVNLTGNGDGRGVQLYPKVAAGADGDFIVAWEDRAAGSAGTGSDIRARRYGLPADEADKTGATASAAATGGGAWSPHLTAGLLLLALGRRRRAR